MNTTWKNVGVLSHKPGSIRETTGEGVATLSAKSGPGAAKRVSCSTAVGGGVQLGDCR